MAAGISDAVDGFLAKRFNMTSELGALLDPLADKALIVSIYVALGIAGALPISLVILVVSRDIMIIAGFMLSWLIGKPMPISAAAGLESQHCGTDRARYPGARRAGLRLRRRSGIKDRDRAGRGLDRALDGLLSRRMAPSYEFGRGRAGKVSAMRVERQVVFWIAALLVFVLLLWLLHEVLLPFVVGAALAYLLDPLSERLTRHGMSRLVAALIILGAFVVVFAGLCVLFVPLLAEQLASFIDHVRPTCTGWSRLVTDHPWLKSILGPSAGGDKSVAALLSKSMSYLTEALPTLWSKGAALLSVFSLLVITPVVAFYLLADWDRVITTVDALIPLPNRDTVRGLFSEIDRALSGYLHGQFLVCAFSASITRSA